MSDEYKKLIIDRIRDQVNGWIEELKEKHADLLLTKQWRILFPKGFVPGHNAMPVITHCRTGQHLVAEIQFVLPDDLNLDVNDLQLVLKDEGYQDAAPFAKQTRVHPVPIDEPLEKLNKIVLGINDFLAGLGSKPGTASSGAMPMVTSSSPVRVLNSEGSELEEIKRKITSSALLPEWIKSIESRPTYDEVIAKLSVAFQQYQRQMPGRGDIGEFFEKYSMHLLNAGHLHHYCSYKGKPIEQDERGLCTEAYCSKKPYNSKCLVARLRFGATPD
jgi:hypothetical protein